jgi:hypothetical protein
MNLFPTATKQTPEYIIVHVRRIKSIFSAGEQVKVSKTHDLSRKPREL